MKESELGHARLPAVALALALAGCAPAPAAPERWPPPLDRMVQAARDDAAGATGIAGERWQVLRAEPVTWPDGSLGCPAPDRLYTQALVPGYLVQLRAEGQTRAYHAGASAQPRHCPGGRARPPLPAAATR